MYKNLILGADVGGSHITSALIDEESGEVLDASWRRNTVSSEGESDQIIGVWSDTMNSTLTSVADYHLKGIGVAMPGPFNYEEGVSLMKGVNKFDALYGINIKSALRALLKTDPEIPISFMNDAACFGLGESREGESRKSKKIIAITLGTGFGATFLGSGKILTEGRGVPPLGELWDAPYLGGIAEDHISGKWILEQYNKISTEPALSVAEIAKRATETGEGQATRIFHEFGQHLGHFLSEWLHQFQADLVVIGGNIARASELFLPSYHNALHESGLAVPVEISRSMERSAIRGAAEIAKKTRPAKQWRKSGQRQMPQEAEPVDTTDDTYNIFPSFDIGRNKIFTGYGSLAKWISSKKRVMIDGIPGNDWELTRQKLDNELKNLNIRVQWQDTRLFQKSPSAVEALFKPYVGAPGDVWGKKTDLRLADFFDGSLENFQPESKAQLNILIGPGAALAGWDNLIYMEVPKNEIQYRMRAGMNVSLSSTIGLNNPAIYKRLYFVDWVVNKNHRQSIDNRINIVADTQWRDNLSWAESLSVYDGLEQLSRNAIRARPWFEPGAWGGQWLKQHIPNLNQDEVNYAWSFELIVPENGVVLESEGNRLEVPFEWLMEHQSEAILGEDEKTFGTEFPIRFDFLDTIDGGNLSIQCHPSLKYITREFGERITQDETYYILDCMPDATVYLGFQDNIQPESFKKLLEESAEKNIAVNIPDYVQVHEAKKHDLFLIPNQTIHSAGRGSLVLEISATPYIFTFKMYDWLRLDLEGNPRPINIDHAFKNLDFSRKGKKVIKELISSPKVIATAGDARTVHLPTHEEHFYDVHRIDFSSTVKISGNKKCLVMMLVEGESIIIKIPGASPARFLFAETFIIPAGIPDFEIVNEGRTETKLIKAFLK